MGINGPDFTITRKATKTPVTQMVLLSQALNDTWSGLSQVVLYIKQFLMSNKMAWSNYYYSDLGQRDLSMI